MKLGDLRLVPGPGEGLVARWPGLVLVAAGGDAEVRHELIELAAAVAAEGADAATFAHRLAAFITAGEPADLPSFAALADAEVGIAVVLRGDASLSASAGGEVTELSGRDRPTWVDDYLREEYDAVAIGVAGWGAPAEPGPWELPLGVVPGGGALLVAGGSRFEVPPAPARVAVAQHAEDTDELPTDEPVESEAEPVGTEPEPVGAVPEAAQPEPVEPEPVEPVPEAAGEAAPVAQLQVDAAFESVDFGDLSDVAPREPLPVARNPTEDAVPLGTGPRPTDAPPGVKVRGLQCIKGHFNHPRARYCALCGISMVQQTQVLVEGERPPLGILVFGDGKTVALDSSYLLGRDPSVDGAVRTGELRPIELDDPDQILSRVHCEVRLSEWDVQLVDRNSSNGTFVRTEGAEEWRRLDPDEPATLGPGMEARVGPHRFVYESHHQQA